jgi:2-hydroxychromene-2-carboxylate isomerase
LQRRHLHHERAVKRFGALTARGVLGSLWFVKTIEFWFGLSSTYSYVAAMRIEALAAAAKRQLAWRPFLPGPIFQAQQGSSDSPFNRQPERGRYMWRDLERLCAKYQLPFRKPSEFPRNALLATRVALLGEEAPWGGAFARAIFRANFAEDRDVAREEVVREVLESLQLDASEWIARAGEDITKQRLRARTNEAMERGIFGAPDFFVGGELFFGQDRLEDALDWQR